MDVLDDGHREDEVELRVAEVRQVLLGWSDVHGNRREVRMRSAKLLHGVGADLDPGERAVPDGPKVIEVASDVAPDLEDRGGLRNVADETLECPAPVDRRGRRIA